MNLIVVDYHELVQYNKYKLGLLLNLGRNAAYIRAVRNIPKIGKELGKFFRNFIRSCRLCARNLHLIGFSLGAHVAHHISQELRLDGVTVARITGTHLLLVLK